MHWIIIAVIAIIIISIISWLWESGILPTILVLLGCAAAIFVVHWLYSRVGCPVWLILALSGALIVYNMVLLFRYINLKAHYMKLLEKASVVCNQIIQALREFEKTMKNKILMAIDELGMATDCEIFGKLGLDSDINELHIKRDELRGILSGIHGYSGLVKEMREIAAGANENIVFEEQMKALVSQEKIKIETTLNRDGQAAESWDKNLYRTTRECLEASNMLPPVRLEID